MKKSELKKQDEKFFAIGKSKLGMILQKSKAVKLEVNFGGGAYTDGKSIVVGTPEFVIEGTEAYDIAAAKTSMEFNYMEVWVMRMALLIHEASHILFSSFDEIKLMQDWAEVEFSDLKAKLSPQAQLVYPKVIRGIVARFTNALEDGRVENFMVNKFPGSAKYLRALNGIFWKMQTEPSKSNVHNLMMSLCYIATSGIPPQYYTTLDPEIRDCVESVWKDVSDVTMIASPKLASVKMKRIIKKLKPFIEKELIKEMEDAATMKALMEFLLQHMDFSNAKPAEKGQEDLDSNSISIRIPMPKGMSKPGKGSGKGSESGEPSDEESDEEGEGSGKGSKSDKKDEDKDGKGSGEGDSDDDSKDGKDGDDGKEDKDGKDGKDGKSKSGKDGEATDSDESKSEAAKDARKNEEFAKKRKADKAEKSDGAEDDSKGQNQDNNGAGTNDKNVAPDSVNEDITEINESVKEAIDQSINEAVSSAKKEYDSQVKKAEKEANENKDLTSDDVNGVMQSYDQQNIQGFKSIKVDVREQAPPIIIKRGKLLKRQLEEFFKEQETFDLTDQHSGRLNKKALRKVAVNDFRLFEKKGKPNYIDTALEVLWDGSGSMCGEKQKSSTTACATIEEALKSLMPMRIVNFTTEGNMVKHFEVKGFEDNDMKRNYAYSYGVSRSFGGGNKDGYSIKIATRELLKRSESQKIMIILSDGAPSDYPSHKDGLNDVKTAVKEAREQGIKVIAMFFGTDSFLDGSSSEYQYMYEKNLISCHIDEIEKYLKKEIRKLLMQK